MSTPPSPVLMSGSNPEGWTLEDLMQQLRIELHAKNERIESDPSPTSKAVRANNLGIIDLLSVIEGRQRDTLARLDALRPDPGPGGPPRIGAPAPLQAMPAADQTLVPASATPAAADPALPVEPATPATPL